MKRGSYPPASATDSSQSNGRIRLMARYSAAA